jgi:hypothetical protein
MVKFHPLSLHTDSNLRIYVPTNIQPTRDDWAESGIPYVKLYISM